MRPILDLKIPLMMPSSLKNSDATFQRAMSYAFHDIKNIVEAYLHDFTTKSRKRVDHPKHLWALFNKCNYYRIRFNPHKCKLCVKSSRLLGFIMSKASIMV